MLTRKHSIEGKHPFEKAAELFQSLDADAAMKLAMMAGDVTLVLDDTGTILDAAFDPREFPAFSGWIGQATGLKRSPTKAVPRSWKSLAARPTRGGAALAPGQSRPSRDGGGADPLCRAPASMAARNRIAFGRDLREAGKLQQRLLQVQQSLERDYLRMRQLEARYRMLFERSTEGSADHRSGDLAHPRGQSRKRTHWPASAAEACRARKLPSVLDKASHDTLQGLVGAALVSDTVSPSRMKLARGARDVMVSVTRFHPGSRPVSAGATGPGQRAGDHAVLAGHGPGRQHARCLRGGRQAISKNRYLANAAFVELIQAAQRGSAARRGTCRNRSAGRASIST